VGNPEPFTATWTLSGTGGRGRGRRLHRKGAGLQDRIRLFHLMAMNEVLW